MGKPVINIDMRKILIIDKSKSRKEIIYDVVQEAKSIGYEKDTMLRRLNGIKNLENEEQFYFMVRKIVKSELPEIDEIRIMKTEKFETYL